jgi:hypothetical protein
VLTFFDKNGLIYTHIVPRGVIINTNYTIIVLGKFMKHLRKKRPVMVKQVWFLHWDNVPAHTSAVVKNWLAARAIQVLPHPPYSFNSCRHTQICTVLLKQYMFFKAYSPDLMPANFFLFRKMKEELDSLHLTQESLKSLGRGCEDRRLRRVRCHLQAVVRAMRKLYPHWQ